MYRRITILMLLIALFVSEGYSQKLPRTLRRDVKMEKDAFTGDTIYTTEKGFLSIVKKGDSCKMYITLSCNNYAVPIKLKRILVSTDGAVTTIEKDSNFTYKAATDTRLIMNNSALLNMEFKDRVIYIDTWKADATPYMSMINSILEHKGKIKFEGENNTVVYNITHDNAFYSKLVMKAYKYFKGEQ